MPSMLTVRPRVNVSFEAGSKHFLQEGVSPSNSDFDQGAAL